MQFYPEPIGPTTISNKQVVDIIVVLPDGSIVITGGFPLNTASEEVWRLETAGSTQPNFSYTYTEPGKYDVILQGYNDYGFNCIKKNDYITVTVEVPEEPEYGWVQDEAADVDALALAYNSNDGLTGDDSQFRWRIRAGNQKGWGDWSQTYTFTNGQEIICSISTPGETDRYNKWCSQYQL